MKVAVMPVYGSPLVVALVDSADTLPEAGNALIERVQRHFRTFPIMLVSIEENGFRAHAAFQTAQTLALLQLEQLRFEDLDLDAPIDDGELPF